MNISTKKKMWIVAYGMLFGVWVGVLSGELALGFIGFLTAVNFGILADWSNS